MNEVEAYCTAASGVPLPVSYLVWKSGATFYARNGETGVTEFSDADAYTVIQACLDAVTGGGRIHLRNNEFGCHFGFGSH
jgi:hypothetical protein